MFFIAIKKMVSAKIAMLNIKTYEKNKSILVEMVSFDETHNIIQASALWIYRGDINLIMWV